MVARGGNVGPFPERIGHYELLLPIASGGMATVYLARGPTGTGPPRLVAVKLMHPHLRADAGAAALDLLEEAKLAARIRHPNVVRVFEAAEDPHGIFLVMEYVEGETLSALLRDAAAAGGALPPPIALRILADVLGGLHAAHELCDESGALVGLVHRDFSPQNILVGTDGASRLTDFGIAKAQIRASHTQTGVVKGKAGYMSPEQARGRPLDRRSDVWAAAVVAWETFAGRRLYARDLDPAATLLAILHDPLPRLRDVRPDLPPALDEALAAALHRDRDARVATAASLWQRIAGAWAGIAQPAEPAEVAAHVQRIAEPRLAEWRARLEDARFSGDPPTTTFDEAPRMTAPETHASRNAGRDPERTWTGPSEETLERAYVSTWRRKVVFVWLAAAIAGGAAALVLGFSSDPRKSATVAPAPSASAPGDLALPQPLGAGLLPESAGELKRAISQLYSLDETHAETALVAITTSDPTYADAAYYLALARGFGVAVKPKAMEAIEAAKRLDQRPSRRAMLEAMEAFAEDDFAAAEQTLRAAVGSHPGDWELLYGLGEALQHGGDADRANDLFSQTLDLAPHFLLPWFHGLDFALARGDGARIEQWASALDRVQVGKEAALTARMSWQLAQSNPDAATALWEATRSSSSEPATSAVFPRVAALVSLGRIEDARRAVTSVPRRGWRDDKETLDADTLAALAFVQDQRDVWRRWMDKSAEQAKDTFPERARWVFAEQAIAYVMAGELDAAAQALARVREVPAEHGTPRAAVVAASMLAWKRGAPSDLPTLEQGAAADVRACVEATRAALAKRPDEAAAVLERSLASAPDTRLLVPIAWLGASIARQTDSAAAKRLCTWVERPRRVWVTWFYARSTCGGS